MKISFENKIVVVVGGTTGIGKAAVKLFALAGGKVVFSGIEDPKDVNVQDELDGCEMLPLDYVKVDISNEDSVKKLAAHVDKAYGGCDVLYNNAGILLGTKLHETSTYEWQKTLDVNLNGFYYTSKYFIPQMIKKGGGAVVNTSSVSGIYGDYGCCAYNTSKGGVTNLTRAMALDYAPDNIRVNAVCPGSVRTQMYDACAQSIGKEKCESMFAAAYPAHRIGFPEEIAKVVLFLCSEHASYVNGINMPVDGGLTAHTGQPRFMD